MTPGRLLVWLCALSLTAVAGLAALEAGVGGTPLTADFRALSDAQAQMARLDGKVERIDQRAAVRQRLVEELIAGERTLIEVAAWFDDLNREVRGVDIELARFPGDSHGERVCRQVIRWAAGVAKDHSAGFVAEVTARLESDLDRHLREHGSVELPRLED